MRLTQQEQAGLIEAVGKFAQPGTTLYLYGSRVKDDLKGGDIDLLLVTPTTKEYEKLTDMRIKILCEIEKHLGERRIDLLITYHDKIHSDPFIKTIFSTSVAMKQW